MPGKYASRLPLSRRMDCSLLLPQGDTNSPAHICGLEISMILHLSVGRQTFIEDCEVCCEPIESSFTEQEDELGSFQANTLG
jgi:hypothetical protein